MSPGAYTSQLSTQDLFNEALRKQDLTPQSLDLLVADASVAAERMTVVYSLVQRVDKVSSTVSRALPGKSDHVLSRS